MTDDSTDDEDESSEEEPEYIINGRRAYGRGEYPTDALREMVAHWHGGFDDEETLQYCRVRGFEGVEQRVTSVQIHADETIEEYTVTLDGVDLDKIAHHEREAEIIANRILGGADYEDVDDGVIDA
jgi:hypothetical protein